MSICKWLSKKFGGAWRYSQKERRWFCDDGNRWVFKTLFEHDGLFCLNYKDMSKDYKWIRIKYKEKKISA